METGAPTAQACRSGRPWGISCCGPNLGVGAGRLGRPAGNRDLVHLQAREAASEGLKGAVRAGLAPSLGSPQASVRAGAPGVPGQRASHPPTLGSGAAGLFPPSPGSKCQTGLPASRSSSALVPQRRALALAEGRAWLGVRGERAGKGRAFLTWGAQCQPALGLASCQ